MDKINGVSGGPGIVVGAKTSVVGRVARSGTPTAAALYSWKGRDYSLAEFDRYMKYLDPKEIDELNEELHEAFLLYERNVADQMISDGIALLLETHGGRNELKDTKAVLDVAEGANRARNRQEEETYARTAITNIFKNDALFWQLYELYPEKARTGATFWKAVSRSVQHIAVQKGASNVTPDIIKKFWSDAMLKFIREGGTTGSDLVLDERHLAMTTADTTLSSISFSEYRALNFRLAAHGMIETISPRVLTAAASGAKISVKSTEQTPPETDTSADPSGTVPPKALDEAQKLHTESQPLQVPLPMPIKPTTGAQVLPATIQRTNSNSLVPLTGTMSQPGSSDSVNDMNQLIVQHHQDITPVAFGWRHVSTEAARLSTLYNAVPAPCTTFLFGQVKDDTVYKTNLSRKMPNSVNMPPSLARPIEPSSSNPESSFSNDGL